MSAHPPKKDLLACWSILAAVFPGAIAKPNHPVENLLAIGIDQEIVAQMPTINPAVLSHALGLYTRSGHYLNALAKGAPRIHLSGEMAGMPAETHQKQARDTLDKRKRRRLHYQAEKNRQKKVALIDRRRIKSA